MANLFAPDVVALESTVQLGKQIFASSMLETSDIDGNPITTIRVYDNSSAATGSSFVLDGVIQDAFKWITVDVADLHKLKYKAGLLEGNEGFSVQVRDYDAVTGTSRWSNVAQNQVYTVKSNNFAPSGLAKDGSVLANEVRNVDNLFTFSDPDGNEIVEYMYADLKTNSNGGYFFFKGQRMESGKYFSVMAEDRHLLRYVAGKWGTQSENLAAVASDGEKWSSVVRSRVTTTPNDFRPEVTAHNVKSALDKTIKGSALFSASDPDGNSIKYVEFWDSGTEADGIYYTVNGVRQDPKQWFRVLYKDVDTVVGHIPDHAASERLRVRVSDGFRISTASTATIDAIPRPVMSVIEADHEFNSDYIFDTPVLDLIGQADAGPEYTHYQFFDFNDDPTSGYFIRNESRIESGVVQTRSASTMEGVTFRSAVNDLGREFDTFMFRGWNGKHWTDWQKFDHVTDPNLTRPLDSGTKWFSYDPNLDKTVIYYTFIDGTDPLPTYYDPANDPEANDTTPLSPGQRAMVRSVLHDQYEVVSDLKFIEVAYERQVRDATIIFGAAALTGAQGWAYLPAGDGKGSKPGDIWLDTSGPTDPANPDNSDGGYGKYTVMHEIGHAIGFKHPHEGFWQYPVSTDNSQHTVMSYNTGGTANGHIDENPSTLMLYDIQRLQELYGVNEEYNLGNDHYFFDNSHQQFLYDSGGIDTINLTTSVNDESINLRQGHYSTLLGQENSLLIPYGVVIENVRGGAGNDRLEGNHIRNIMIGNEGNDTFIGSGGNDLLRGGAGNDTYIWNFGDGRDKIMEAAGGGIDVLEFHDQSGKMDSLADDFRALAIGDDLRLELTLDRGHSQGTVLIDDFRKGGSRVEILRLFDSGGRQIGDDIELDSIYQQASTQSKRFKVTDQFGTHGFLAVPV